VPELSTIRRKAFLLSQKEVFGADSANCLPEGQHLEIFNTAEKMIAYLDSAPGIMGDWWSRTAELIASNKSALSINQSGAQTTATIITNKYLRPAITLPESYFVFEDGFVHEDDEARKFQFADEYSGKIRTVVNDGDVPIGFVMLFYAEDGDFSGIHLRNLKSGAFIDLPGLTVSAGDTLEVSTKLGEKWARILHANGTQEFVFSALSSDSTFFEIDFGKTQVKVWADNGDEHMRATLFTREDYVSL
jgi:hypothetical protein